jgi:hypothetical protein
MAVAVADRGRNASGGVLGQPSIPRAQQGRVQLAFDHALDEAAHPITHSSFDRVEPIVEKIHSRVDDRLRGIKLRGSALHGVVSYPTLIRRMIRG